MFSDLDRFKSAKLARFADTGTMNWGRRDAANQARDQAVKSKNQAEGSLRL
jgi:hypothetical protein